MKKGCFAIPVRYLSDPFAIGGVSQRLAIYTSANRVFSGFAIPKNIFSFPAQVKYFFRHIGVAVLQQLHA